jgi:hypothetical protein
MDGNLSPSTDRPQVVQSNWEIFVDKLLIKFLLLPGNGPKPGLRGLCATGFLPTMKFQLSQLP